MKCNTPKKLTRRERKQLAKAIQQEGISFCAYLKQTLNMDFHDWNLLAEDEQMAIVKEYKAKNNGEFRLF